MRVSSLPKAVPGSGPADIQTRDFLDHEQMLYH